MCGIGGVIAINKEKPFSKRCQKDLIELLRKLQSRGEDAWGIYIKHTDEKYHLNCWKEDETITGELFKLDGSVDEFFNEKGGVIDTNDLIIALFHTRAATSGDSKKIENNHPFMTKDFILAHNGGITNHTQLKTSENLTYSAETDSAVIVALIQKYYDDGLSIPDAIKETCKKLEGGYACWLYHKETDDVYLFKKTNPVSVAKLSKRNIVVFASESRMIHDIFDVDYSDILTLTEYDIYRIHHNLIEKIGEIPHEIATRNLTGWGYRNNLSHAIDKEMIEIFQLISRVSSEARGIKISRIYNNVYILTDSQEVLDIVLRSNLGATIQYLKDSKGKYYRFGIPITSLDDLITALKEKLRDDESTPDDTFDALLTCAGEELGFDWEFTTEGYLLQKNNNFDEESEELFRRVGLHFSKKGILFITKDSSSYISLKKMITRYLRMVR